MPNSTKQLLMTQSRPDVFLYKPKTASRACPEYIIVEVKYCRDTDPTVQLEKAKQQHKALADAIKTADPSAKVTYLPVLLGVAGTIYTTYTTEPLTTVGIKGNQLSTLANALNEHAVQSLHWIYTTKRKQEQPLLQQQEQGGRKRRKFS